MSQNFRNDNRNQRKERFRAMIHPTFRDNNFYFILNEKDAIAPWNQPIIKMIKKDFLHNTNTDRCSLELLIPIMYILNYSIQKME